MGLYAAAAAVLAGVESRQGSLQGLVYSSTFQVVRPGAGKPGWGAGLVRAGGRGEARPAWGAAGVPCVAQNLKQLYALVCETQRYSAVLDAVIASAGLLRAEKKLRPHLAKVSGGQRLLPVRGSHTSFWGPS